EVAQYLFHLIPIESDDQGMIRHVDLEGDPVALREGCEGRSYVRSERDKIRRFSVELHSARFDARDVQQLIDEQQESPRIAQRQIYLLDHGLIEHAEIPTA